MIGIARRRKLPGTGSGSLRPSGVYRMQWPDLTGVLAGVPWAIAGGVATRRYMPERSTDDLDIVVHVDDEARVESLLSQSGYERQGALSIGGPHWRSVDGVPVDLIPLSESWAAEALEEASRNLGTDGMPVLPLPYLVLLKMYAVRTQDIADVERMLAAASPEERTRVRETVARLEPALIVDLDSTMALARFLAGETDSPTPGGMAP